MKVYKYRSYSAYKAAQVKANKAKLAKSWVRPDVVDMVCARVLARGLPSFGLCHGTRRGEEQKLFKDRLKCKIIGTEISDNAEKYPDTIRWDFHKVKEDWLRTCDFVYSNSLDHAMNPRQALAAWLSCLNTTGVLAVEWIERLGRGRVKTATASDPFSATVLEVCDLIESEGGEIMEVVPLTIPERKSSLIFARRPQ